MSARPLLHYFQRMKQFRKLCLHLSPQSAFPPCAEECEILGVQIPSGEQREYAGSPPVGNGDTAP